MKSCWTASFSFPSHPFHIYSLPSVPALPNRPTGEATGELNFNHADTTFTAQWSHLLQLRKLECNASADNSGIHGLLKLSDVFMPEPLSGIPLLIKLQSKEQFYLKRKLQKCGRALKALENYCDVS